MMPFIGRFLAKKIEFETPNRIYCSKPSCSTFIPPQGIKNDVVTCIRCSTLTCAVCKKAAHANSDCPDDPAAQQLLQLATQEGWQKCYSCARFVELEHGCNHISQSLPHAPLFAASFVHINANSCALSLPLQR
jgi:hypothetical protein